MKYEEYEEERMKSTKRRDKKGSESWQEPGLWKRHVRTRLGTGQWKAPLMQDIITEIHNKEQAHWSLVPAPMNIHSKAEGWVPETWPRALLDLVSNRELAVPGSRVEESDFGNALSPICFGKVKRCSSSFEHFPNRRFWCLQTCSLCDYKENLEAGNFIYNTIYNKCVLRA